MNTSRLVFLIIFGIYHIVVFSFAYYIDGQPEDILLSDSTYDTIHLLKQVAFVGLVLFTIDLVWSWYLGWSGRKREHELQGEIDKIKARMYDMQTQQKPSAADTDVESDTDEG